MLQHFLKGTRIGDRMIPAVRRDMVRDPNSTEYGAVCTPVKGFGEPSQSNYISLLVSAYYNPHSRYYQDASLLEDALCILNFMLRKQHPDGTIDLRETNFHCASTVGFSVQVMAYTWRLIDQKNQGTELEKSVADALYEFLRMGAEGMKHGGFHTPNHRWVLTSALSLCANILGDEECRKECSLYLGEGIDCDANGEYTERSAGIYNVVNNRSLIIAAEELGMPELLEYVRRNLRMVPCYFEPDGTVFTMNSTRQDSSKKLYPIAYYENYMLMACKDHDAEFSGMAEWLFDRIERMSAAAVSDYDLYQNVEIPCWLTKMQLDESLIETEVDPKTMSEEYHRFFEESGIVRDRKGNTTYTILANSPTFLVFQRGTSRMSVKFGCSYYGKGQMISPRIVPIENGYRLEYAHSWGYTRPFANGSDTPDWRKMDHTKREHVLVKTVTLTVDVVEENGHLALHFASDGMDELPAKMEFTFEAGGYFQTGDIFMQTHPGEAVLLKGKTASYDYDGEVITLTGGCMEHSYTSAMRGTEPNDPHRFTVYTTAMGQFNKTVLID
ncbi:MAG: hypothetical protein ACOX6P_05025 [Candidatus Merdivicinus sp.]